MVHNFGKWFLCFVFCTVILSAVFCEGREDDEEIEEIMNLSNGQAELELSGSDRFKKSIMGLFGSFVTQKPHHKAETELAFPPPRDAFLSTRGKKFYPGSGSLSSSGRQFQHEMSLIPVSSASMSDFKFGLQPNPDWSWKIPVEPFLFSRGRFNRVRGVNSDYIQNAPNF